MPGALHICFNAIARNSTETRQHWNISASKLIFAVQVIEATYQGDLQKSIHKGNVIATHIMW
jgi:hypothetical protein